MVILCCFGFLRAMHMYVVFSLTQLSDTLLFELIEY